MPSQMYNALLMRVCAVCARAHLCAALALFRRKNKMPRGRENATGMGKGVQDSAGGCRRVQEVAGVCKSVQKSTGVVCKRVQKGVRVCQNP